MASEDSSSLAPGLRALAGTAILLALVFGGVPAATAEETPDVPEFKELAVAEPAGISYSWTPGGERRVDGIRLRIYQNGVSQGYDDTEALGEGGFIRIFQAPDVLKADTRYCFGMQAYAGTGPVETRAFSEESERRCLVMPTREDEVAVEAPRPVPTATPRPSDLSIRNIRGKEDLDWAVVRNGGGSYLIEMANARTTATGNVVVDIQTSGVVTIGEQIEIVQRGWAAAGFICAPRAVSGGANAGLRCTGGTLKAGQVANPAVIVKFTGRGIGTVHASIGLSSGAADYDQSDNGLALSVRVN